MTVLSHAAAIVIGVISVGLGSAACESHREAPPRYVNPPPEVEATPRVLAEEQKARWGERLVRDHGCLSCHGPEGSESVGPALTGTWGATRRDEKGGRTRVVNEDYVRESLVEPQAFVVAGYPRARMPAARFSDRQLEAIQAFMRTPRENPLVRTSSPFH